MYEIDVLLPESGTGFVTNNRGNDEFQFGQQSTIDAALAVGVAWDALHPNHPFSIGQISVKGGGHFDDHASHLGGLDVDVRPMRLDGKNEPVEITWAQYDRPLTTQLINLWWEKAPVQLVYFNDQTVINAGLSTRAAGHHHHFHVRLRRKDALIRIHDRGSDVAEVQTILGIVVDGRFGPDTLLAVEAFQTAHGLHVDGLVGRDTWAALRNLSNMPLEFAGSGLPLDEAGVSEVIGRLNVGQPELWAVLKVETSGCGFLPDRRPVILFERHQFSNRTNHQFDATHPDISNQTPGDYGAPGAHQYDRLHRAINLNRKAALRSTSWGIGQLMGFNAELSGYSDVEAMVTAMTQSENDQLLGMAGEIINNGLDDALREHRWADFAEGYNGVNYAVNHYDTRLAAAYQRYAQGGLPVLMVRAAQMYLLYLGYKPGPVDGLVGSQTFGALNKFQQQNNLPIKNEINDEIVSLLKEKALADG